MVTGITGPKAQGPRLPMEKPQEGGPIQKGAVSRPDRDTYIPGSEGAAVQEAVRPSKDLTAEMAGSLAKKYDVKALTRNGYGSLLLELRDLGVISSQDFSVGFGGAVPYVEPDGVEMTMGPTDKMGLDGWPYGDGRADFTELLRSCAKYCSDFSSEQLEGSAEEKVGNSLLSSYRRLSEIFDQIASAAGR